MTATEVPTAELIVALQAMLRCPGIDHTDQEQGESFRTIVEAALAGWAAFLVDT